MLLIAHAGTGNNQGLPAALEVLQAGASVEVVETANPGELDGALHRAGSRRIVVAGGDGSLHAVIATLHRRQDLAGRTLGLLPLGTGNDFARTVGIPLEPEAAADVVLHGLPRPMDLLVDELGDVVVNNVHLGASAAASMTGAAWKERLGRIGLGILGYPLGALQAAIDPPIIRVRVQVDDTVVTDIDRRTLMVAIGNGATVGGGTAITPDADPEDGRLDVVVSRAVSPLAKLGYGLSVVRGTQTDRDDVLAVRGRQVTVAGDPFWVSADGEISGPERRRTWHIEPAAYRLITPDVAPAG